MCNHSENLVIESTAMQEVMMKVDQVAPVKSTVLLTGETGVGKTLIAKEIYQRSSRKGKPFLTFNCATAPESIIESELFGHEKGAFTGADSQRIGHFEDADGGTLFIEEIGTLPLEMQTKFLDVLEKEQKIKRMGNNQTLPVDVRVIVATNEDIDKLIAEGKFRQDLFQRINVFPIHIPPLRERRCDIPELVKNFIEQIHKEQIREEFGDEAASSSTSKEITKGALAYLQNENRHWVGNVRELQHKVESAMVYARGDNELTRDHFIEAAERSETLLDTLLSETDTTWEDIKGAYVWKKGPTNFQHFEKTMEALLSKDLSLSELDNMKAPEPEKKEYVGIGTINNFATKCSELFFGKVLTTGKFIKKAITAVENQENKMVDDAANNETENGIPT